MKCLSKSISIMFLFDLLILYISTIFWCDFFELSLKISALSICLVILTGLIVLFLKGNYKIREFNITLWNTYRLFEASFFANIPVAVFLFFFITQKTFIGFVGFNILTIFTGIYLYRLCFHFYLFHIKKVKKVLIIGANDKAKAVTEVIKNKKALQMEVVGIVKAAEIDKNLSEELSKAMHFNLTQSDWEVINKRIFDEQNFDYTEYPIFENGKDIVEILNKTNTDIVIWAYKSHLVPAIPQGIKMYLMPEFYEMATGKIYVDEDTVDEFAYDVHKKYSESVYDELKRAFDIISALIILIVTLPITSYIALRVWLTDKHSPFFTQTRVGKNGKKFECYKLRTMYVNDYVPKNAEMLNDGADRTIPFCKWIRKVKLDEIPQMVNILKGEMSIVGPRAEWEDFANVFEKDVPYYKLRNIIPSGWTGWAHINMQAAYSVDEEKERLAYDLYYIKHRNILWDIAILVKAVFLACGGRHK